jgi:hypothetical protein
MRRLLLSIAFCFFISILAPQKILAKVGVGVGTGKIVVEETLRSGEIYNLPPFTVLNTGDEDAKYSVTIASREKQTELKPSKEWFSFNPGEFYLKPGEAKTISIKLSVPLKTVPGEYFCFVEGYPIQDDKTGEAKVGIAAAAKLYFKVSSSNIFMAAYYRVISLWKQYLPWTNIAGGAIAFYVLINLIKRNVNIKIGLKKKQPKEDND